MSGIDTEKRIKCVVACHNAAGESDFYFCFVTCAANEYDIGRHYEIAEDAAEGEGYGGPMVVFDENDGPDWLFERFDWRQADNVISDELEV